MSLIRINYIKLLLKRDFILNKKRHAIFLVIFFSAIIAAFCYNNYNLEPHKVYSNHTLDLVIYFAYAFACFAGLFLMNGFANKETRISLLMLPTSRLEYFIYRLVKVACAFIVASVLFVMADYIYVGISPLWVSENGVALHSFHFSDIYSGATEYIRAESSFWSHEMTLSSELFSLSSTFASLSFISIFFPSKTIIKYLLFAIVMGALLITAVIIAILIDNTLITQLVENSQNMNYVMPTLGNIIYTLVFMALTYYRFNELESIDRL